MKDDIKDFFEELGEPDQTTLVGSDYADSYRGKLPDALIDYWLKYGFTRHTNGLFWIVDPGKYEAIKDEWLKGTNISDEDNYYVIARSAFGELYLWGSKTGDKYIIDPRSAWILKEEGCAEEIKNGEENEQLLAFLSYLEAIDLDVEDENDQLLFSKAVKKHGDLKPNEVFGFEPAIFLGGDENLKNISKVNIFVHLSILAQFGHREILDQDALIQKSFGD